MSTLISELPVFAYQPAVLAFAVLCLAVLIQAFLTAPLAFLHEEQSPGKPLRGDHTLLSFRVIRTHANSVENLPVFGFALLLAILAGVGATTVNWLAGIHVVSRLAFWVVYYSGIGKVAGGPRTLAFLGGSLSNLVLIGMTIYALAA